MGADEELLPGGPAGGSRNREDWSKRFDESALPEIDVVDADEAGPVEPAGGERPPSPGGLLRTPEPEILDAGEARDLPPPPAIGAPAPPEPELSAPEVDTPEEPAEEDDDEEPGTDLEALVQEALAIVDGPPEAIPAPPEPEPSAPEVDTPQEPAEEDDEEPGTDLEALVQEALAIVEDPPEAAPAPVQEEPEEQYLDGEQAREEMSMVLAALRAALGAPEPSPAPADAEASRDEVADPPQAEAAPRESPPAPKASEPPSAPPAVEDPPPMPSAPPEPWQRIAEDLSDQELDRALDVFERLAGKGGRIDIAAVTDIAAAVPEPAAARAAAARDRMLVGFPPGSEEIVMTIAEIERVAGPLPAAARSSGIWWSDWIARSPEGYRWRVNLDAVRERVVFRPVEESALG